MYTMTLHAQADLWQQGTATFAALFMESDMRSSDNEVDRSDVLLDAVMNRGLRLAADLSRLALGPRRGWAVHLNPAGALTLTWPHIQPLLLDAPMNLPTGWREAAAQHGLVLLFVGDSLGLRDNTKGQQTSPGKRSLQAAERGDLAAGAIAYPPPQREPRPVRQTGVGDPTAKPMRAAVAPTNGAASTLGTVPCSLPTRSAHLELTKERSGWRSRR